MLYHLFSLIFLYYLSCFRVNFHILFHQLENALCLVQLCAANLSVSTQILIFKVLPHILFQQVVYSRCSIEFAHLLYEMLILAKINQALECPQGYVSFLLWQGPQQLFACLCRREKLPVIFLSTICQDNIQSTELFLY